MEPPKRRALYIDSIKPSNVPDAIQSFGTIGSSKYDSESSLGVNNIDQVSYLRAVRQGKLAELGNATAQTLLGIPLGILENAGYLAELPEAIGGKNPDYTNSLVEFMTKTRQGVSDAFPIYRENPNELVDMSDSAWWVQNGQGLVESVGEFFATGAGVGGGLGKGAKGLNKFITNQAVQKGVQGTAIVGTSASLAYTEGAMSGARVYKDVYENAIKSVPEGGLGYTEEEAKALASSSASKTVKLNTGINTLLNITSVAPLLKTYSNLDNVYKLGLNRRSGEGLSDWAKRLDDADISGLNQSLKKTLISEAVQEGLEEDVNVFAEKEGRVKGQLQKSDSGTYLGSFGNSMFSEEGALNFFLGAFGGVAQTAGINYIPYRNYTDVDGSKKRVSNNELRDIQQSEQVKNYLSILKDDITTITDNQKKLEVAVLGKNKQAIEEARNNLFNVAVLRSIREGVGEEFTEDLKQLASVDNTTLDEQGMTPAMKQGLADSPEDNQYKETAMRKAASIPVLQEEYKRLNTLFENKYASDKMFGLFVTNKTKEELLQQTQSEYSKLEQGIVSNIPSTEDGAIVLAAAKVKATELALKAAKEKYKDNKNEYNLELVDNLIIEAGTAKQALASYENNKNTIRRNKLNINTLSSNLSGLTFFQEELIQDKKKYNDLINNKEKVIEQVEKERDDYFKKLQEVVNEQKAEEDKVVQSNEKERVKEENKTKTTKYSNIIGSYEVQSTDKGFVILDRDAGIVVGERTTLEEAEKEALFLDQKSKKESKKAKEEESKDKKYKDSEPEDRPGDYDNVYRVAKYLAKGEKLADADFQWELNYPKRLEALVKELQLETPDSTSTRTKNTIETPTTSVKIETYQPSNLTKEDKETEKATFTQLAKEEVKETNKVKYAASEYGESLLIDRYKLNHSSKVKVGDKLTIKIDKQNKDYIKGGDKQPIGIYREDKIIGYVSLKDTEDTRKLFKENEDLVLDSAIIEKGTGKIITTKNNTTAKNLPSVKNIAILKKGDFYTGVQRTYDASKLLNRKNEEGVFVQRKDEPLTEGGTYAMLPTPNGKEVAVLLDRTPLSKEIADSIYYATTIYLGEAVIDEDTQKILNNVFKKYNIDLTSLSGYNSYVSNFLGRDLWLSDRTIVAEINQDASKANHKYFLIDKEKIKFFEPTRGVVVQNTKGVNEVRPRELSPTQEPNIKEKRLEEFREFLYGYYHNLSLEKLQENKPINLPILKEGENQELVIDTLSAKSYVDYIKDVTTVNIGEENIGNGEVTHFYAPAIYYDTSFLGSKSKETYGEVEKKSEEKAILTPKKKSPFRSMTSVELEGIVKAESITDTIVENNKRYCT